MVVIGVIAALVIVSGLLLLTRNTSANFVGGTGGSGGSCGTWSPPWDFCTTNGYGWQSYAVSGSARPFDFADRRTWSSVVGACNSVGADTVWTFVIRNSIGGNRVYSMSAGVGGYGQYPSVLALYNEAAASGGRVAGTPNWGGSLAWFCYNSINFDLTPTIGGSPAFSSGGSAGSDNASLRPAVNNTGTTSSRNTIQWMLVRFVLAPGLGTPVAGTNTSLPVNYFGNGATRIAGLTGQAFPRGVTQITVPTQPIGDFAVGTRICYALSVQPITRSNSSWRHSTPFCVIIAKSPKAQVRGGDIRVGSNFADQTAPARSTIVTSQTRKTLGGASRTFGSWGEYAISATGRITGIGSGAAFAGPGLENPTNCSYTFLTFANATTTSCLAIPTSQHGQFATGRTLPDVVTSYPASASAPVLSGIVSPASLNGTYRVTGDITLSAGVIPRGRSVIINAFDSVANTYRNVTISGNITYTTDSLTNGDQIPQLIIIASNISIQPTVSQVDAWLIARGTLNTCAGVARTTITTNSCNTPLTVNGPVMANQLQLWRTAGSNTGVGSGDPAEVFNLRPDAYLWGLSQSSKSGRLQTVYEKELPPRF